MSPKPAKERLLAAATRVFARDGLDGATTRAIAHEAGVNEVTLFRVFGSKKKLLAEVVANSFNQQSPPPASIPVTDSLRDDLTAFVQLYEARLLENIALVRTMIGDLQRHREHEVLVLRGIFQPLRAQLVARIESARASGIVRREIDSTIATDQLTAMIFTSVLKKQKATGPSEYRQADYLKASIDLLVRGIAKRPAR